MKGKGSISGSIGPSVNIAFPPLLVGLGEELGAVDEEVSGVVAVSGVVVSGVLDVLGAVDVCVEYSVVDSSVVVGPSVVVDSSSSTYFATPDNGNTAYIIITASPGTDP